MDETLAETAERAISQLSGLRFSKGHGTGNDFVLIADPDGMHVISPDRSRRCATGTAASAATGSSGPSRRGSSTRAAGS